MRIKYRTLWHFGHPALSGERSAYGVVDEDGYWRIISKYIVRGDVCGGVSGVELSEHRV
jgi:hypothetical protein